MTRDSYFCLKINRKKNNPFYERKRVKGQVLENFGVFTLSLLFFAGLGKAYYE